MEIVSGTQVSRKSRSTGTHIKLYKAVLPLHFRSLFSLFSVSDTSGYISPSS